MLMDACLFQLESCLTSTTASPHAWFLVLRHLEYLLTRMHPLLLLRPSSRLPFLPPGARGQPAGPGRSHPVTALSRQARLLAPPIQGPSPALARRSRMHSTPRPLSSARTETESASVAGECGQQRNHEMRPQRNRSREPKSCACTLERALPRGERGRGGGRRRGGKRWDGG